MENTLPLRQISINFTEEIKELKKLAIRKYSNLYKPPRESQIASFKTLVTALLKEDLTVAANMANELDYELTLLTETESLTERKYYRLRENPNREGDYRGWGSYFFNVQNNAKAMVQIPHILADKNTEDIGGEAFLLSNSRIFLLAGAHRHANGCDTADVCDPRPTIFQSVHEVAVDEENLQTWQIHGFKEKEEFPMGTKAIMSNGKGQITEEIRDLDRLFEENKIRSHVYNTMLTDSPENLEVNGTFSGEDFESLGATQNVQGQHSNGKEVSFVHVELSDRVRAKKSDRNFIASIIAESIKNSI